MRMLSLVILLLFFVRPVFVRADSGSQTCYAYFSSEPNFEAGFSGSDRKEIDHKVMDFLNGRPELKKGESENGHILLCDDSKLLRAPEDQLVVTGAYVAKTRVKWQDAEKLCQAGSTIGKEISEGAREASVQKCKKRTKQVCQNFSPPRFAIETVGDRSPNRDGVLCKAYVDVY